MTSKSTNHFFAKVLISMAIFIFTPIAMAQNNQRDIKHIKELTVKADQGDSDAQEKLSFIYFEGKLVKQNADIAYHYAKKSSEQGNPMGINYLAGFNLIGFGTPKSVPTAIELFERSAALNNPKSSYDLGIIYYEGEDVEKNLTKAFEYILKAAKMNYLPAIVAVAGFYWEGIGTRKDTQNSIKFYEKAAELGDAESSVQLGRIFSLGLENIMINFNEAKYWYKKGIENGSKEAKTELAAIPNIIKNSNTQTIAYISKLKKAHGSKITYSSSMAEKIVREFNIDCKGLDGRYLPLEHVLLVQLAAGPASDVQMMIKVDAIDGEARIYEEFRSKERLIGRSQTMELNKWGELKTRKQTAIMNSCFHGYGHIWLYPQ